MAAKKSDPENVVRQWLERDLTAAAANGELPPAFEVDDTLRRVNDVITSGRHPILGGESGVGKSASIYELVRRVHAGTGPAGLRDRRIVQFSLRTKMSGLTKPEQMRPEMQKLVDALIAHEGKIVPFFRDMHLAYDFDLEPQLEALGMRLAAMGAPILGEGDGAIINSMLEHTPGLEQYYIALPLHEPPLPMMEKILAAWAKEQARKGKTFAESAQKEALQLAHRFLARSRLPRKVLDFLGQVGSLVEGDREVVDADVIDRFFQSYRVPRFLIDPTIGFDVDATERMFRSKVLGQNEAVRTVVRMISLIKAGLSDTRRPFGAFLFVGPTGVGKTHIAQLLADFLFGSKDRMVRLNMADYQNPADAYVLFGNPDGYNARQRRGVLTARLMGHPFAVLLLDEFEKAHEKVHDRFLQLMDEGAFINGSGETVPCRSIIIIATSNAGAEVYRGQSIGFTAPSDVAAMDRELDRILHRTFRIEFLNRFDQVVHFHPLTREDIRIIALREVEHLRDRGGLKARGLALEIDEAILDWLTAHGYDPHYGARFLRRTIERSVTTAVAEVLVREQLEPGTRIGLGIRGNQVVAKVADRPSKTTSKTDARPAPVRLPLGTAEQVRTMDRKALRAEAEALLSRAGPHLERLRVRRDESAQLLSEMNAPDFWEDKAAAQPTLDRYRAVDVAIQADARLAQPLLSLRDLESGSTSPEALARALERAARALQQWDERVAEEGPSAVWVLLRNADPLDDAEDWLQELVAMQLAWCTRLHLAAEVIAWGQTEDKLARVALEAEGPGAAVYLAMEQGVHRLHRTERGDLRVRIDVVPRHATRRESAPRVHPLRPRAGYFDLESACAGRVEREERGLFLDFQGTHEATLSQLLSDLDDASDSLVAGLEVARTYAHAGSGARDPRTGANIPRYKDVMKGRLDPILEGWRRARYGKALPPREEG
jgi:ATP-dependent Clp protease ATP-binding subunit ClpC